MCLDKIFQQKVLYLQAVDTKNRRAKGIIITKTINLKDKSKAKVQKKRPLPSNDLQTESSTQAEPNVSVSTSSELNTLPINEQEPASKKIKLTRHHPSKEEKAILETIFAYDMKPPDTAINSALTNLLTYWDGWTIKKIKNAWGYEKRKGKQNSECVDE